MSQYLLLPSCLSLPVPLTSLVVNFWLMSRCGKHQGDTVPIKMIAYLKLHITQELWDLVSPYITLSLCQLTSGEGKSSKEDDL